MASPARAWLSVVVVTMYVGQCVVAERNWFHRRGSTPELKEADLVETRQQVANSLLVLALPVGQGDATVLVCPEYNGNVVVFDMGSLSKKNAWTPATVRHYLQQAMLNGDRSLYERVSTIIVSHPDYDHYSYLPEVFPTTAASPSKTPPQQYSFPPHTLRNNADHPGSRSNPRKSHSSRSVHTGNHRARSPGQSDHIQWRGRSHVKVFVSKRTEDYRSDRSSSIYDWLIDVKAQLFAKGQPCIGQKCYRSNDWTESLCGPNTPARFQVLGANLGSPTKSNEQSVALKVTYDGQSVLLVGDLQGSNRTRSGKSGGQQVLLRSARDQLKSTIYKVSHHGAWGANPQDWLAAIRPKVAVVSSTYPAKGYGHPHCPVLDGLLNLSTLTSSERHTVHCRVSFVDHEIQERQLNRAIYATSPTEHRICLLQLALPPSSSKGRRGNIAGTILPQLACWKHDYGRSLSRADRNSASRRSGWVQRQGSSSSFQHREREFVDLERRSSALKRWIAAELSKLSRRR